MMRYNSKKSQGRIKINTKASDKLRALFSQESDAGMVSSAAEHATNGKGDATAVLSTSSTTRNEGDHADTCAGVNSLPRIVITPPPANGNEAETKDGDRKRSPPPFKLPLLPKSLLRPPERVCSAGLRRTPATNGKKQPAQPPLKLPLIQPQRVTSASLRRKQSSHQTRPRPTPIGEEKEADNTSDPPATASLPSSTANDQYSDDFEEDDDDNEDDHDQENQDYNRQNQDDDQGNQDHDDINDADNEEEDSDSDDDVDDQTTRNSSNRPITGVNRCTTGGTFNGKVYQPCVIPGYQRMFSGAAVISPLVKTMSAPSLGEMATLEQLPVVVSADLQPGLISQQRKKREPNRSQLLIQKMTSQYALTPLKMIADKLVTLHYDVHPTEISPGINRAPSFVGKEDDGFELMSGRSSPKLNIPRHRYCGLMIKQHPLVRHCCRMTDRRLARVIKRQLSSSSSSSSSNGPGDYDDVDGDPDDVYDPKDKPVAVKAEKKVSFSKKPVVPPISCKPAKDSKPLVLIPSPPSQSRPASGQAASLRAMRKARMEKRQQQTKTSTMAKKQ